MSCCQGRSLRPWRSNQRSRRVAKAGDSVIAFFATEKAPQQSFDGISLVIVEIGFVPQFIDDFILEQVVDKRRVGLAAACAGGGEGVLAAQRDILVADP